MRLEKALAKGGSEPSLGEITLRARRLLADTDARLAEQQERSNALDKYRQFSDGCDLVRFHGTLFTGLELPAQLEATQSAARNALGLFGLSPEREGSLTLGARYQRARTAGDHRRLL